MQNRLFILNIFLLIALSVFGQSDRSFIRSGNRFYRQQNYAKAEAEYRKALAVNSSNPQALYNLGCALMMQQKDSAAIVQYQKAGQLEKSKLRKSRVFHNIGVVCQNHKMYGDAINAYKESLRNNPKDDQTRYNLALCKRLAKNNPQNKNKNKEKNKNKDKGNKDKKQEKEKKNQRQQKQNPSERMSKDNAEQLLNAAMQEEKATQQRVKDAMRHSRPKKLDKNW